MMVVLNSSYLSKVITENPLLVQWLLRIVVTIAIMLAYHFWQQPTGKFSTNGQRLQDARSLRSGMLEKLEKSNNEKLKIDKDLSAENRNAIAEEEQADMPDAEVKGPDTVASLSKEDSLQNTPSTSGGEARGRAQESTLPIDGNSSARRPPIRSTDSSFPGLDGFRAWYDVQSSIYRIYTVGKADGSQVFPPFLPKSERGHIPLTLRVSNNYRQTISVYWVNYRGDEIHKGNVRNGSDFLQTTWIGHPWVFREMETGRLLCHYIPYRIIPNTREMPTIDNDDNEKGVHRFTIYSLGHQLSEGCICHIYDPVFPVLMKTPQDGAIWAFQEMSRAQYLYVNTLIKYLTNIVMHPEEMKYRQIRIANPRFREQIWNTPARGLLLAAGFVEHGSFAELGSSQTLPRDRVQDISSLLFEVEKWKTAQEKSSIQVDQPKGADGFGRANFGRPGLH